MASSRHMSDDAIRLFREHLRNARTTSGQSETIFSLGPDGRPLRGVLHDDRPLSLEELRALRAPTGADGGYLVSDALQHRFELVADWPEFVLAPDPSSAWPVVLATACAFTILNLLAWWAS